MIQGYPPQMGWATPCSAIPLYKCTLHMLELNSIASTVSKKNVPHFVLPTPGL